MAADLKLWLPINRKEMELRGWDEVDVVLISGDAYVDHPSFGAAVIGRVLEQEGCRVAILPQPNWRDDLRDFKKFGKPRYFFGITSGAMDSMVNHYTALKRLRSTDAYTAGNQAGFRPDYATSTYSRIVRQLFPESWIVLGGVEASMRRLTHYDYWSDSLMPSILASSGANLLVYGMGESPIREITAIFKQKENPQLSDFKQIPQIAWLDEKTSATEQQSSSAIILPSHETCLQSKREFAEAFRLTEEASVQFAPPLICQSVGEKTVVVNPQAPPMSSAELDAVYELPFTRLPHPHYEKRGEIPAFNMIQNSINIHRGCFGGCSFCTISLHQGKRIVSRSKESILKEVEKLSRMPYFKGHISDMGGPSANMYQAHGSNSRACEKCRRISCIYPEICPNLHFDHAPMLALYREALKTKGVQKITIGSGIRTDMIERATPELRKKFHLEEYADQLVRQHVSGRLKVAPEHTEQHVLAQMRKPAYELFLQFRQRFNAINRKYGLKQQLIPYFISSHPGCRLQDMQALARKLKAIAYQPEQVQDFTPTPMTRSSVMFYTGLVPETGEKIFCETDLSKKRVQNQCFFQPASAYKNQISQHTSSKKDIKQKPLKKK